ncbi:NAD(P)-dependent oxidoreductase [Paenibacillus camerounensis]|uniref:NAD(P)-dependent oxidoreductase n=1 Tax=Paenibacillus camerounensis TaxID=1243663 RepID=UPI0005A60A41|nr:NAD(P)-dependent oxidoreductase [Paenibacillus camerounensis]
MHKLGWIGLGHMGAPMAMNLLQAGYEVNVYNRSHEKTRGLVEKGAKQLNSSKEVVDQSDIIFIMLSDSNAVNNVLMLENGVLEAQTAGKVVINMSTISPEDALKFAGIISENGGQYLDAPVSGSVGAAMSGQLVILTGGDIQTLEEYKPYFDILGKSSIHFGTVGKGSSAKLAINMLLGIMGQGIAEALVFADKAGLDKEDVLALISQSGMNSPLFQAKKEMYRNEEFPSAFMLELMTKDLGLVKEAADLLGTTLPLAEVANETFISAEKNGKAKLDMAAIYLEIKDRITK